MLTKSDNNEPNQPKIEKLPFTDPSTPAFYWDDVISGFGVKVGSRSKTYIFQGRVGRKSIRIKIANVNDMRLDEAKEKAKKQIPLRVSATLYTDLAQWAEDDFRAINGQIEYLLTECVKHRKKTLKKEHQE